MSTGARATGRADNRPIAAASDRPGAHLLSRRRLLAAAAGAALASAYRGPLPALAAAGSTQEYDDGNAEIPPGVEGDPEKVLIIGAGWAGLTAANALRNAGVKCTVLEARRRIGGRARTVMLGTLGEVPIDLGCSWIHEPIGNPMATFADQAGVRQLNADIEADAPRIRFSDEATGEVPTPQAIETFTHLIRFGEETESLSDELGPDASARDGAELYLSRQGLTGDALRRARFLLRLILQQTDAIDWRKLNFDYTAHYDPVYTGVGQGNFPEGGYHRLITAMAAGIDVRLGQHVRRIERSRDGVTVVAHDRASDRRRVYRGSHAIVTLPLGVLQARRRGFRSGPAAVEAARDPGAVRRPVREGRDGLRRAVLGGRPEDPHPPPLRAGADGVPALPRPAADRGQPALVGLCSARFARRTFGMPQHRIYRTVTAVLERVLGRELPMLTSGSVALTNWERDPFTRGAYTSIPLGATLDSCDELARPVGGRVLFAGEATSRARIGYADGAMSTGIREAKRLLRAPSVQISAG